MPDSSENPMVDEFDAAALVASLRSMCEHPRFRRYRMGVRCLGDRTEVFEGVKSNIKAVFMAPLGERHGQLFVHDSIIRTMIRVAGDVHSKSFLSKYGRVPRQYADA